MPIEPYLFFNGRCDEAITFYRSALGAEVQMLMRYSEAPDPTPPGMLPPDWQGKVMHASLRIGDATLMASDGNTSTRAEFHGFSLSITRPDIAAAQHLFATLADGGNVMMPLAPTFWSPGFGMLTDRFGVPWMVSALA